MRSIRLIAVLAAVTVLFGACTTAASPSTSLQPSVAPSASATATESSAPTEAPSALVCDPANLATLTPGKLTIGTDNPAFPPWFGGDPPKGSTWQVSDPTSGKGYESATAYAIAKVLGYAKTDVDWVVVPFANAIQPGKKSFDILLNQVSYSPERAQAVDLSVSYFEDSQAVVALKTNKIASAQSVAGLKAFKLGAAVSTTSYSYITDTIQPTTKPSVYNTNDAAIAALKAKQIDGIVVDLGTAFYMTGAQLDNGVIVGSLPTVGAGEHFSVLMTKDSTLTACINNVIARLTASGGLAKLRTQWIETLGNAPALQP